jgi:pimeloyl-ACP methyl ester carboxylesterase
MSQVTERQRVRQSFDGDPNVRKTILAMMLLAANRAGAADLHEGAQLVTAAGYTFNIVVTLGDKKLPTIILESGGGADSRQWTELQPRIATETHAPVISYNRPGFGQSPLPNKPYDIVAESDAFREAVTTLGLGSRVILVGSSYGGFLVQLWASRAPKTVAGVLFLDPNSPAAVTAMGADLHPGVNPNPQTPQQIAQARVDSAGNARFVAVYSNPLPLDVPVTVVSAGTPLFQDRRLAEIMTLSHQLLAASSHRGKRIVADGAAHNIAADRPDVVIACVKELLDQ